jgi:hypothetical protein
LFQLSSFIRVHNQTLSIAVVRVRNEDRLPLAARWEIHPVMNPLLLKYWIV